MDKITLDNIERLANETIQRIKDGRIKVTPYLIPNRPHEDVESMGALD